MNNEKYPVPKLLDILLPYFISLLVALVLAGLLYILYTNNNESWVQAKACDAQGGVMMQGVLSGCVKVQPIGK